MPVTIKPSPEKVGKNGDSTASSEGSLFWKLVGAWEAEVNRRPNPYYDHLMAQYPDRFSKSRGDMTILHSSFKDLKNTENSCIIPYGNGFVDGIIRAFQQDLHLALRPDDVWLAILTQFSFYVDKNAEKLRSKFVKHEGQQQLKVENPAPFRTWDIGVMAEMLMPAMKEHMADEEVHDWAIPVFSTTTKLDMAVASMVMMAAMKSYFIYIMSGGCGFPSVTLHGEPSDWEKILKRLDKFSEYGEEPTAWAQLLKPIIKRFIATFYLSDSAELKDFWMHTIHAEGKFGSGKSPTFDGWLTAFMYWDKNGCRSDEEDETYHGNKPFILDGQKFPILRQDKRGVPTGVVEVPVTVEALDLNARIDTRIVAGSMGMTIMKNKGKGEGETVQPCSGWWMLEKSRKRLHED